jgi:tetratricopeptide (TPR) repeat protein
MKWLLLSLGLAAQADFDRGVQHFQRGDYQQARAALERAVKAQPRSFEARFVLGAALVELKDTTAAIESLRAAVAIQPAHLDARKLLTAQLIAAKRFKEAAALLQPGDEETHLLLIEARQGAGDAKGAFALATAAGRRFPKSAQIAAWLGFQHQFAGRFDEAKTALQRALAIDPALPMALQLMGEVSLKEENFAEAVIWLRQAPRDVETALLLSRARMELGQLQEALDALAGITGDRRIHLLRAKLYYRLGDEGKAREEAARAEATPTAGL